MNVQEQFWAGDFGKNYTARNRVEWTRRIGFFEDVLKTTEARNVLEVGCNAGWNLRAVKKADPSVDVAGIDINQSAIDEATKAGLNIINMLGSEAGTVFPNAFDMVMTVGVLIHIAPDYLKATMQSIINASKKWVLCVEYYAKEETPVVYHGEKDRLWKRPFGGLYEKMGLNRVLTQKLDKIHGFDDCIGWLFHK